MTIRPGEWVEGHETLYRAGCLLIEVARAGRWVRAYSKDGEGLNQKKIQAQSGHRAPGRRVKIETQKAWWIDNPLRNRQGAVAGTQLVRMALKIKQRFSNRRGLSPFYLNDKLFSPFRE